MRHHLSILLMVAATAPAYAADTTYTDPRQPSFTLLIPDGWTAMRTESGVVVSLGKSFFHLGIIGSAVSPGAALTQVRPQVEKQWQQFHETESGQTQFGGQPAAFAVYTGIPPSGVPSIQRVVAMTNGTLSYWAFEDASQAEARTIMPELAHRAELHARIPAVVRWAARVACSPV
jgi:hypothetical protein